MEFTGERFVPGQTDIELEIEHMNRYQFARQFVKGKRVLDAACGVGFGTELLSRDAEFVTGIDISEESIAFAQQKYGGVRVSFQTASVEKLPFQDSSFDVVISFETLEHIDEIIQQKFLAEIDRVLTDNGILVMSTPNHSVYSKRGVNEFHVKELEYDEFESLLKNKFSWVKLFSQQFEICNAIVDGGITPGWTEGGLSGRHAEYLIAVCFKNHEPHEITPRVIVRSDEKLNSLMSWAIQNHELNQKNNIHLTKLNEQISLEQQNLTELRAQTEVLKTELQNKSAQIEQLIALERTLKGAAEQQSAQIEELEENLRNKTAWVEQLIQSERALKQEVLNKQGHIQRLLESDRELNRIKSSRSWRFLGYVWKVRDVLIPKGSKRRLAGKMLMKFVKHPFRVLSKCSPKRIGKFFKTLQKEGTEGVSHRLDDCLIGTALPEQRLSVEALDLASGESARAKTAADYAHLSVLQWDEPKVSIVIPVYNQFDYTYLCVKSILKNSGDISYEIILADDCSSDMTRQIDDVIQGLHTIHNTENLRFLRNCNNAAKKAKGQYILFLNNDTQVQENWLEPLVSLIERDERIGMVGSKLVYPDGRLQEAGGIFWNDGSAWNYGNRSDPAMPEYNYVKEVDYISGAAIMLRRTLWEEIGGFDDRFAPAYCEDSDLAFEVRSRDYKVFYQPLSVVVHFEGVSNGTDTTSGQKAYQVANQKKFYEKWKSVLKAENFPNGENIFLARDRSRNKKTLLMVDHYVPMYDKDAGSRTIYQYLRLWVDMGFSVKFIGDNFFPHQPYTQELQQMGVEVLYGPYYAKHWKEWLKENGEKFDVAFLNRPHVAEKYIDAVKKYTRAKLVYNLCDLHYLREQREYELSGNPALLKSSQEWKVKEFRIVELADTVFTLSVDEKRIIDESFLPSKTVICPIFIYDTFYQSFPPRDETKDLLFVGGFNHNPNGDAVLWFCTEVLPKIQKELLNVRFHIVGSNPPEEIQTLESEAVILHGYVSDDELERLYAECRVCVIPLRYGAGVKGKTIEAMYHGIPIVTTSTGIEGLPGIDKCISATNSAEAFACKVVELYWNGAANESSACYEYVRAHYSRDTAQRFFAEEFDYTEVE